MLDWMKQKLGSRLLGEISITSNMQITPHLMAESKELKSLLMQVKEGSDKNFPQFVVIHTVKGFGIVIKQK